MTFYTSLSGLQAAQIDMSVISHNIANVATDGFKKSRTSFADVIASSVSTDPRHMVGSGVLVQANRQQFDEGATRSTSSALDLMISGDSFFTVKSPGAGGTIDYTRNGAFMVDSNRNVVDAQGGLLQAYPVDATGAVTAVGASALGNVQLPQTSGTAVATKTVTDVRNLSTTAVAPAVAFDRANPASYNNATSTTIYDAAGNAQSLTSYYVRDPATTDASGATLAANSWKVYTYVGSAALTSGGTAGVPLTFDSAGALTLPTTATAYDPFTPTGATASQSLSIDMAGTTQSTAAFSGSASQDGTTVGKLQGVTVDSAGIISASFSNGDTKALGKVALASFVDPTGLRQQGDNYWTATGESGSATMGGAGDSGFGDLKSGMLEGSNVDITEELVALIAAQRNFQANSKALDTQNKISETIYNIQS